MRSARYTRPVVGRAVPVAGKDGGGVCTLRGRDAVRILADEFQASHTLDEAYDLLHRPGFSCLKPRPVREDNDPAAAAAFKAGAPFL